MALNAPTLLDAGVSSTTATTTCTSGSFTPSANALVMVVVAVTDDAATIPSISLSSTHTGMVGGWSSLQVSLQGNGGSERIRLEVFLRNAGAAPSAGTVTATVGGTVDRIALRPAQITSTVGGNSAYRVFGNLATATGTATGSLTATLPTAPAAANYVLGFAQSWNEGGDIVPGTGYTQLFDHNVGTANADRFGFFAQYRTGTTDPAVPVTGMSSGSTAPSVVLAFPVEELAAGTAHTQAPQHTEALTDSTVMARTRAQAATDAAGLADSTVRHRTVVVTDAMTVWDAYPSLNFNDQELAGTAGVVTLRTVWLNDADDLSDLVTFPTMSKLVAGRAAMPEVRRLAGGRHRLIRRAGVARTFTLTLPACDRAQVDWLEAHVGELVCCRDDRGRKVFGTYLQVDVTEFRTDPDLASCAVTLREVYHDESTGGTS